MRVISAVSRGGRQRRGAHMEQFAPQLDNVTRMGGKVCERCVGDLLYCDRHDAYFCPVCDLWVERACPDPECPYCPGRPEGPSGCSHPDSHYSTDSLGRRPIAEYERAWRTGGPAPWT